MCAMWTLYVMTVMYLHAFMRVRYVCQLCMYVSYVGLYCMYITWVICECMYFYKCMYMWYVRMYVGMLCLYVCYVYDVC